MRRLFVGVALPSDVVTVASAIQSGLAQQSLPIRFERPEKLHITVRFLGATSPDRVDSVIAALRHATTAIPRHAVTLGPPGAFPNVQRPNVIWVGVGGAIDPLLGLETAIGEGFAAVEFARESRPFHPHITIGRVHRDVSAVKRRALRDAIRALPTPPALTIPVDAVVLFESVSEQGGTRYERLETFPLSA